MAVYTQLSQSDVEEFLTRYELGKLDGFQGITEGVSNTNYLLIVAGVKYILTLFESSVKIEDLPYFTALMQWWRERGIHCPQPIKMNDGRVLSALGGKPALLVSFLEGEGVTKITNEHMLQLGKLAADMHISGQDFPHSRANSLSPDSWHELRADIGPRADDIMPGLAALLRDECHYLGEHWPQNLPGGPIHADLFPDNVFFSATPSPLEGEGGVGGKPQYGSLLKRTPLPNPPPQGGRGIKLSGVIDFYYACNDAWAYDLAICVNAWCFDDRHRFVPERAQALMHAYTDARPLTPEEEAAFPLLLRGAALRFLLTRTRDWLDTPDDAQVTRKDPLEYVAKLRFHQGES